MHRVHSYEQGKDNRLVVLSSHTIWHANGARLCAIASLSLKLQSLLACARSVYSVFTHKVAPEGETTLGLAISLHICSSAQSSISQ